MAFDDDEFIEILGQDFEALKRRRLYVDAFVATVDPKLCGAVVKRVSAEAKSQSPDTSVDLRHLKRVRRTPADVEHSQESLQVDLQDKTPSSGEQPYSLEVLLGSVTMVNGVFHRRSKPNDSESPLVVESWIEKSYQVKNVRMIKVPGRFPLSQEEWGEYNHAWPTVHFPNKFLDKQLNDRRISKKESIQMIEGMQQALADAKRSKKGCVGTIILNPDSGSTVGQAALEEELQKESVHNPLQTSVIYAIQSVSRCERDRAMQQGMNSSSFQGGSYLCTGCDVYTTHEPSVLEAMALLHSRIRRLIIGYTAGDRGGLSQFHIQLLPGTNHQFRVFLCNPEGDLAHTCAQLSTSVKSRRCSEGQF